MLKQVDGIIISETSYNDSSKIINILTQDGIIGVIAKGAKNIKSGLRVSTMKLTYGRYQLYYNNNKLSTLKEADIINEYVNIKKDITLMSYMAYLCDLSSQIIKQNVNKDVYELLISSLNKINDGFNPLIICNIYELKMLDYLGVGISFDACAKCGSKHDIITIDGDDGGYICKSCYTNQVIYDMKTLKMLRMYYLVDINSIKDLKISDNVIYSINHFINIYYDRYTGLYLKSKKLLETLIK